MWITCPFPIECYLLDQNRFTNEPVIRDQKSTWNSWFLPPYTPFYKFFNFLFFRNVDHVEVKRMPLNFKNRPVRTGDLKGGPKQPPLPLIGVARSLPLIGLRRVFPFKLRRIIHNTYTWWHQKVKVKTWPQVKVTWRPCHRSCCISCVSTRQTHWDHTSIFLHLFYLLHLLVSVIFCILFYCQV